MTDATTSSPGAGRERAAAAAATRGGDEPLLFVEDLHTYYGESHALQGVSLRVHAGEVVCLLGRNGAGKSTTLNSIVGLTPARSGTVRFDGEEIRRLPAHRIARRGLALVPEDRRIFAGLSVTENLEVASPARPARVCSARWAATRRARRPGSSAPSWGRKPGIVSRRSRSLRRPPRGMQRRSPTVYGCRGPARISSAGPSSTSRPA